MAHRTHGWLGSFLHHDSKVTSFHLQAKMIHLFISYPTGIHLLVDCSFHLPTACFPPPHAQVLSFSHLSGPAYCHAACPDSVLHCVLAILLRLAATYIYLWIILLWNPKLQNKFALSPGGILSTKLCVYFSTLGHPPWFFWLFSSFYPQEYPHTWIWTGSGCVSSTAFW